MTEEPDLKERLHTIRDHLHTGAVGQREVWEEWLIDAIAEIERLEHNQMSTGYTTVAQVAALQAQEADARKREADFQQQRAEKAEQKQQQQDELFSAALLKAMTLVDELLRENVRLCAASSEPPNMRLFTAKNSWEAAMKKLLAERQRDQDEIAPED